LAAKPGRPDTAEDQQLEPVRRSRQRQRLSGTMPIMNPDVSPASQDDPVGRHRRHRYPGRPERLTPRLSAEEMQELKTAAAAAAMTPTGYLAEAALAYARRTRPARLEPLREQVRLLQLDLFQLRTTTGRLGVSLDEVLAAFVTTGTVPPALADLIQSYALHLNSLDELIDRVDEKLR
jgi:hypothetical protein